MISEIDKRCMNNEKFLSSITALHPQSPHFLKYDDIEPVGIAYSSDCSSIKSELNILKNSWKKHEKINNTSITNI